MVGIERLLALCGGLLLDRLLGEARAWHPLVGFGLAARWTERHLNDGPPWQRRLMGVTGVITLLVSPVALTLALRHFLPAVLVDAAALYLAVGWRSLDEHAGAVSAALDRADLPTARAAASRMVSRDTGDLDEEGIARATIESVLENGNDAIFGALFWTLLAGAPGVVLYRLANTLDAMWGYRTPRLLHFGWCAARLDDLLNYVPARLTALAYALLGQMRTALRCWRRQAPAWDSPNAGPVMAAGAGALGLCLGGAASYGGHLEQRPPLGEGRPPRPADITRACALVRRGVMLWLCLFAVWTAWELINHAS
ncbi:MAG: adenosylcobinamide-phosphate synthase CbiB [Rhodocyclaceae bacterium]